MRKLSFILSFLLLASVVSPQELTPKQIVKKADQVLKGVATTKATLIIKTVRKKWSREMVLKSWAKGTELSMILITSPLKDKGTVFLMKNKEVWNWIPAIERTIKMPPSMMMQNWMGTDFTNDDLVKESSIVEDYTHKIIGDSTIDGRVCYKMEMIPKEDAAVAWGRIVSFIDKKDFFQLKAEFYDEDDELVNIMQSSDIKMMGGKMLPTKMEMIPVEKKEQKTIMIYTSLVFNELIKEGFFSTQNMKRVK